MESVKSVFTTAFSFSEPVAVLLVVASTGMTFMEVTNKVEANSRANFFFICILVILMHLLLIYSVTNIINS